MGIRDFLRGGIYDAEQPVTVMRNNVELGTWYPKGQGVTTYYNVSNTSFTTPTMNNVLLASSSSTAPIPDNIRAAVSQLHAYLNPEEGNDGEEEST